MTDKKLSLRDRRRLVRSFRKQMGLSLVEFGALCKLSNPMLSQFENGNVNLSKEAWSRVIAAIEKLLDEDEARRKQEREKAAQSAAKLGAIDLRDIINAGQRIALLEEINKNRERLCALQDELIALLRGEDAEKDEKIARLEEQKKLLVDLLDTETDKALAGKRATELREKIVAADES